jgi:hypothetical protein
MKITYEGCLFYSSPSLRNCCIYFKINNYTIQKSKKKISKNKPVFSFREHDSESEICTLTGENYRFILIIVEGYNFTF